MRGDREDVTDQVEAVAVARLALADALLTAAGEAKALAKRRHVGRSTGAAAPDLTQWRADVAAVSRAEESLDLALLDLATARGEDA